MENPIAITEDVFWIGVNDRDTDLFESLWPLPRGISYNSYLILDQRIAVIDTVKEKKAQAYLDKILHLTGGRPVDYLVINHMEPDHSGAVRFLMQVWPQLTLVGNAKTAKFLENFYGITERIQVVEDGSELDLGGRRLQFYLTPMVHWPETMMTYDSRSGILFSGDAFGGFGALDGGIFDDEVDTDFFEDEILRYFSNIVGKYCPMVLKAIDKLNGLDIRIVAPTHGPVWRSAPERIISDYARWSAQETETGVVIAYSSMYGNTERMMETIARELARRGVQRIRVHNVPRSHLSFVVRDAWRFKALVLGSPTYDARLFPPMESLVRLLQIKRLRNRLLGVFGTYGWSGGAVKRLTEFARSGEWRLIEPIVEVCGGPADEDLRKCRELAANVAGALADG